MHKHKPEKNQKKLKYKNIDPKKIETYKYKNKYPK
jgi:hypothetical protein